MVMVLAFVQGCERSARSTNFFAPLPTRYVGLYSPYLTYLSRIPHNLQETMRVIALSSLEDDLLMGLGDTLADGVTVVTLVTLAIILLIYIVFMAVTRSRHVIGERCYRFIQCYTLRAILAGCEVIYAEVLIHFRGQ